MKGADILPVESADPAATLCASVFAMLVDGLERAACASDRTSAGWSSSRTANTTDCPIYTYIVEIGTESLRRVG